MRGIAWGLFRFESLLAPSPISTLVAGGDGLIAIYDDLGAGVAFSAETEIAAGTSGTEITISLLRAGVAAVQAVKGGQLAIGGGPTGLGGSFAFDGTDLTGARLTLEFAAAQVPMLSPFALYTLVSG